MVENLLIGFKVSFTFYNLMFCFIGCSLGQIIGVLPGLGPTATIAILLTLTYKLDVTSSIIMLAGIYYGAQFGGTITSVMFRIAGETSSVVTIIDGYQMALQGKAGKALGIAAFGSAIAGTFGTIMLSILAPPLSEYALKFGPPEYTTLMFLGLTLVIYLGRGSTTKAILMGAVGLALGTIGMDSVTGMERFTFGSLSLLEGINVAVLGMGLFGISEILYLAESVEARSSRDAVKCPSKLWELLPDQKDWKASIMPISRGTILGFLLGILPGGGAVVSSFASYAVEKRVSKHPEKFGTGIIEGVAGPESANNAAVSGCFIPLLTLGIPTNVVMSLILGAFMLHGVTPGPFILTKHPEIFWGVITSMYIGNVILVILNIPLIKVFVKIMQIPFTFLSPLIILICVIGAYSLNNNSIDILLMLFFGILGYLMRKLDYEGAPLMLAFILGPMIEKSVRQSLIASQGSPLIFFTRPISVVLMGVALSIIILPIIPRFLKRSHINSILDRIKKAT